MIRLLVRRVGFSAFEVDAIDADLGAFAFDARTGKLVDDAADSVHLSVDVAAVDPQAAWNEKEEQIDDEVRGTASTL